MNGNPKQGALISGPQLGHFKDGSIQHWPPSLDHQSRKLQWSKGAEKSSAGCSIQHSLFRKSQGREEHGILLITSNNTPIQESHHSYPAVISSTNRLRMYTMTTPWGTNLEVFKGGQAISRVGFPRNQVSLPGMTINHDHRIGQWKPYRSPLLSNW